MGAKEGRAFLRTLAVAVLAVALTAAVLAPRAEASSNYEQRQTKALEDIARALKVCRK